MTVGIYIRVSTQEQVQEGYSIAAQRERLVAYCAAQGWTDYKFYVDEGISAKDTNRPQLQTLLEHVKQGSIETILVYRLDRFTRSVLDLYNLLDTLEKHNCAFKSATEIYDTSSAMGRMFIGLVALLAQWERENMSERIKMALEEKVSSGERVGGIPYGFDLSEDEKLVKNDKAAVVMDMIEKTKDGMSASSLANWLTKTNEDKTRWTAQAVLRILRNPALYGSTRWNDKVYEDTHEGLITKAEFMKLQQLLEDRTIHKRRDVESTYLFQGVLTCPVCSSTLAVNRYFRTRKDGTKIQRALYKCHICYKEGRTMISIGEERILDAVKEYMRNFTIEKKHFEPIKEQNDELKTYLAQLKQIENSREKYQRAWGKDLLSDEEFEQRMNETRVIYEDLKKKISEYKTPASIDTEAINGMIHLFNENFSRLTTEEKKTFVSRFIRKIDFKLVPKPPARPDKAKKGKDIIQITDVLFW